MKQLLTALAVILLFLSITTISASAEANPEKLPEASEKLSPGLEGKDNVKPHIVGFTRTNRLE